MASVESCVGAFTWVVRDIKRDVWEGLVLCEVALLAVYLVYSGTHHQTPPKIHEFLLGFRVKV